MLFVDVDNQAFAHLGRLKASWTDASTREGSLYDSADGCSVSDRHICLIPVCAIVTYALQINGR
jgi:hypothetical protein